MAEIFTNIDPLKNLLSEILAAEWKAQGHEMTGAIVDEIEYQVQERAGTLILQGLMFPYGNIIAAGIKPGKVPFSGTAKRGQGKGGTSKYIEGLQNYVKARMNIKDEKESLGVAFAIAKTQRLEGMPTWNSYSFSSTGKRMDWVEEAFRKNEDRITAVVEDMCYRIVSVNLDVLLNKWQVELNKN